MGPRWWLGLSSKAVLAEELRAGDVVALEEGAPPLALGRPLPLVEGVQHRVRLHPHPQAALCQVGLLSGNCFTYI